MTDRPPELMRATALTDVEGVGPTPDKAIANLSDKLVTGYPHWRPGVEVTVRKLGPGQWSATTRASKEVTLLRPHDPIADAF